jgi:phospholipase C
LPDPRDPSSAQSLTRRTFLRYGGSLSAAVAGISGGLSFNAKGVARNSNPGPEGPGPPFPIATTAQSPTVTQTWNATHEQIDEGRMDGFVRSVSSDEPMGYWTEDVLPFAYSFARTFPLANRWFCSAPCQTYPNRRFLMAGTAYGDIATDTESLSDPPPPNGTIFDRLHAYGISWRNYFTGGDRRGRGEHAEHGLRRVLAYQTVQAVLHSPAWPRTLLVYTYDEHGGYYDHVPPPAAIPPDSIPPQLVSGDIPGGYDIYGPRVPAVVASPYAKPGAVTNHVHDHTSVLATIEAQWNLPALTYRDANARTIADFLDVGEAAFLEPPTITEPPAPVEAVAGA